MNILFTTSAAPRISPLFTGEKRPPLGMGSLISLARELGHKVFFIDNYLSPSDFIEKQFLQKNKIELVAIYTNTICYEDSLRMINALENLRKKGVWKGKIAVGGPHTSVAVDTIPDFVDFIVQGEGEKAFTAIISGTTKQRIIKEQRMENLDQLPFQPWDIFSKLPYDYTCPWMDSTAVFTMNTSRGCPFDCGFCSVGSIWGKKYTFYSARRIVDEIEYLVNNFKAQGIYFREDNFTLNQERVIAFCWELKRKNIKINWACETRVDSLSEDIIKQMSMSGCRAFYLGVESGSQRILDLINKNITVKQIENVIKWSKKYGIRTYCSLIVGLPTETIEDYMLTKKMIKRAKPFAFSFNVFVGMPVSRLYDNILKGNLYEYKDKSGFLYLPGYQIKTEFFYGKSSDWFVDYDFKQKTIFDEMLIKQMKKKHDLKCKINKLREKINDMLKFR